MVGDVLFELGCEELPSGAVKSLSDALAANVVAQLAKASVGHGAVRCFGTPRRLAVLVCDVQTIQASQTISRRGPARANSMDAAGQPLPSLLGFAKSCGVTVGDLVIIPTDKGDWWGYESVRPGEKLSDLLPAIIQASVATLPIAKPMRWGAGEAEFARPVHWAVLLLDENVVPMKLLGVETGRQSIGHRFHHPQPIDIATPQAYEACLKQAFVIADFALRRQSIVSQVEQLALSHGYTAMMPAELVDEVTSIVEWPQALMVPFDASFLEVPEEALIAAMQSHQKCFALRGKAGDLVPFFITVANIESRDPAQVILGNEKVMRARLSDASFFFHQDKKQRLSQYEPATANVVFQAKLGSLQDKTKRVQSLLAHLVAPLALDEAQAMRAAQLSKCDLMTGMVGEFPELQGVMGYYYARHDQEDLAVAEALREQYKPRFSADELPQSSLGLALSLADRIDTLVGAFLVGQRPTGVKDPFKLRRHALAVIRLLIAIPERLNLSTLISEAREGYAEDLIPVDNALTDLRIFMLERLPSFYQGQGIEPSVLQAVCARQNNWLYDLDQRLHALVYFMTLPGALALAVACKRVHNVLQQASVSITHQELDLYLIEDGAEKGLLEALLSVELSVLPLYSAGDYVGILDQLATLREPVDRFFENVMVMVEHSAIKENRLNLLARLQTVLQGVADISCLSG